MTFVLGKTSLTHLDGVHPQLIRLVKEAIERSSVDFAVQEGLRTEATQREYVKRGVSKTMHSKHLTQADGFGHAVDLVPWVGGQPRWEWPLIYPIAQAMRQAQLELGDTHPPLVWGGVWDKNLIDLPVSAAGLKAAVEEYTRRHPGPDFLDGPHFGLGG